MSERETADTIADSALRWVARADRGLDASERAAFRAWLAGDSRRRGAYLRAEAAWAMLDRASVFAAGSEGEAASGGGVAATRATQPAPAHGPSVRQPLSPDRMAPSPMASFLPPSFRLDRRRLIAGGALAAASLAAGGAWLLLPPAPVRIATGTGEIRRVPLADGSLAAVNTRTQLAIALEPHLRRIELAQGEAWFQVAKDKARPFVVAAGDIRVRAVGTAFSVRRHDDGADVQVTEGVVEVWREGSGEAPIRIAAGARTFMADAPTLAAAPAVETDTGAIERKLAWRTGQIVLDGDTLGEAVAEFNRYNARRLVVDDPALARVRLVGRFRTNEPDAFARATADTLGARVELGATEIHLTKG